VVGVKKQKKKVLRKFERRGELPQDLIRGVQELREDRGRFADTLPPVAAARCEAMAEGAPILRHEYLTGM